MNKEKKWFEYNNATEILISLLQGKKNYSTLLSDINKSNYNTINKSLNILNEIGLIKDLKEETTKTGKYVGLNRYIWLTKKGERSRGLRPI